MAGLVALGLAAVISGCNLAPKMNDAWSATPDPAVTPTASGYRWTNLADHGPPDVLVLLAFSGGGKRSAAFSYGVLRGLREFDLVIGRRRVSMLDQVKYISSVSGGSFTAAYYGLHRERIFTDYEKAFLKRDIESRIYGTFLLPWNWGWMVSPYYGTNDHMAVIYDELMFRGASYADLQRRGKPLISINATDISFGTSFTFTQEQFDLICSDLATYSVARAVAASNGFPILFTPITLSNHTNHCRASTSAAPAARRGSARTREDYLRDLQQRYLDGARAPYIHLMDGGIADNLALRGLINSLLLRQRAADAAAVYESLGLHRVRRIVVILADGQAINQGEWARQRTVTSIGQIFNAVSGTQIDQYNFETILLAKQEIQVLAENLRKARCAGGRVVDGYRCDDVRSQFVHLSLMSVPDAAVRVRLQRIPTGLTISDGDVDALVAAGTDAVRTSPELREIKTGVAHPASALRGSR